MQILDKVVDLVVVQQRVPMVLTVQMPADIPQVPMVFSALKTFSGSAVAVHRHSSASLS